MPGPGQRRPDLQRSSVQIGPYPNRPGDGRGLEVWLTPPFGSPGGLGQDQLVQRQVRDRPTQPQTLILQRLQPFDLIVLCRRTPPSSGNTLSPSPQSFSLLRSSTCTDRSGHQPDAAWRRSLQACGASLPSFHPSKMVLRPTSGMDHLNGVRPPRATPAALPTPSATEIAGGPV